LQELQETKNAYSKNQVNDTLQHTLSNMFNSLLLNGFILSLITADGSGTDLQLTSLWL